MKKYIFASILSLCCLAALAQGYSHRMENAIDAGTRTDLFTFTDTRATADYTNDYKPMFFDDETGGYLYSDYYTPARDIFHKLTITKSMDVYIDHKGSSFSSGTLLHVLNLEGNTIGTYDLSQNGNAIVCAMQPGTYYIVSEAAANRDNPNDIGTIKITIEGKARKEGEDFFYPFGLQPFGENFAVSRTLNYSEVTNYKYDIKKYNPAEDYSTWHDLVYKLTLTQPMEISIDNIGSDWLYSPSNPFVKLLSASMDSIGEQSFENKNLPAQKAFYKLNPGTYYIYSRFKTPRSYVINIAGLTAKPGSSAYTPIEVGGGTTAFSYTDTRNTTSFTSFYEYPTNEVYYKITIPVPMEIVADNCGSSVSGTSLRVMTAGMKPVGSVNDGTATCTDNRNAHIKIPGLLPGTYYLVSRGVSGGNVTTTIKGAPIGLVGDRLVTAIDAGTRGAGFLFSDTKNTGSGFTNQFAGTSKADVFYKFTLTRPLDVTLSHCGSPLGDTYMSLLDASGNAIRTEDNHSGDGQCANPLAAEIKVQGLPAGTYYVVSEGKYLDGEITTTIEGRSGFEGSTPTRGQPNVVSITPTEETTDISALPPGKTLLSIQYFDRFGNPEVGIQQNISPLGGDLVTLTETDGLFRESKTWLPAQMATNGGKYIEPDIIRNHAKNPNAYNDERPYSETIYEVSAQDAPAERYGPGNEWYSNRRSVKTRSMTNLGTSGELACAKYVRSDIPGYNTTFRKAGFYPNSQLYVTRTINEDNNRSYVFKDKAGRTVLIRQMDGDVQHDTYYIYDGQGNLRYVLPPLAVDNLGDDLGDDSDTMKKYAYLYKYDGRNRCTQKRIPGCDWIYYVYDKADRLIMTQDGEQRKSHRWSVNSYDQLGRLIYTSEITDTDSRSADSWNSAFASSVLTESISTAGFGYTQSNFAAYPCKMLSVNYYDNHNFVSLSPPALTYTSEPGYDTRYDNAKGLATGGRQYQLDDSTKYTVTATYYDYRGRVVQTKSTNHLGGTESEYVAYDFTGHPTRKKHVHTSPQAGTVTELYTYTYDHAGRPTETRHSLNGGAEQLLAKLSYDELGRVQKHKAGNSSVVNTSYIYNVRSWTTAITGSKFKEELAYNFDGDIKTQEFGDNSTYSIRYDFLYDGLSRLTDATSLNTSGDFGSDDAYGCHYRYDKQGNAKSIVTNGTKWITKTTKVGNIFMTTRVLSNVPYDNLTLAYNGNQLRKVTDAADLSTNSITEQFLDFANADVEYAYNANGAMTKDLNKGIANISYNLLNLPQQVDINSPLAVATNRYSYSGDGVKLRVSKSHIAIMQESPIGTRDIFSTAINMAWEADSARIQGVPVAGGGTVMPPPTRPPQLTSTTDYVGNKIFENGTLDRIFVDGGYIQDGVYYFYETDHLGDNRTVVSQEDDLIERNDYYPFGMQMAHNQLTNEASGNDNKRKFSGKELDVMGGLNMYDFSARNQDPTLGRFLTVDPLAEKKPWISPYVYCSNNPLRFIDPTGLYDISALEKDKQYGVVAVYQSNYKEIDKKNGNTYLADDVNAAKEAGVPVMLVDDVADYANAMSAMSDQGTSTNTYTLNSHGVFNSQGEQGFKIGSNSIYSGTDVSVLKEGLQGKNVFIGACEVASNNAGMKTIENFSRETSSTVFAKDSFVGTGYKYDGAANGLIALPLRPLSAIAGAFGGNYENGYHMSANGKTATQVYNVGISRSGNISWNSGNKNLLQRAMERNVHINIAPNINWNIFP